MVDLHFESPDIEELSKLEWLVTNGIGGLASGTLSGLLTRRYHGLLIASLQPPVDRVNSVVKLDEWAQVERKTYPLFANKWFSADDPIVPPTGCSSLRRFYLDGQIPTWQYQLGGNRIEKKIWMEQGVNTTYLQFNHLEGEGEVKLTMKAMLANTGFHHTNERKENYSIETVTSGVKVSAGEEGQAYYLLSEDVEFKPQSIWMEKFYLSLEDFRGLDALTDLFNGVDLIASLSPGDSFSVVLTKHSDASLDGKLALLRRIEYENALVERWPRKSRADWAAQLPLSADQFVVQREVEGRRGHSIIAGYHWFSDWGRDTMISLPGLTLTTGRYEVAESILRTYAKFVDHGMLPNRFPDLGQEPVYNSIDATLWYFEAIYQYYIRVKKHEPDTAKQLVVDLFPKLAEIVHYYKTGTRHGIHVDEKDGLVIGGEEGVQLTWMDAKVEDFVVTPRIGKPVEINGLWYSALCIMAEFSDFLGEDPIVYLRAAERVKKSFLRFWNPEKGCCFDVLDGPEGDDDSIRPNQLLAATVAFSPLDLDQKKKLLAVCEEQLLTKFGLRSLAPDEEGYIPRYGGDIFQRDNGYHQGTVWGWLIGPYLIADYQVHRDREKVLRILHAYCEELSLHGLGSISEIFDGDPPHQSRGCIAQAWSVAAALWVLDQIE